MALGTRVHRGVLRGAGLATVIAASLGFARESAAAPPTFQNVTGWKQYNAAAISDTAADWESPIVGSFNTNLVDLAFLGTSPSNSCGTAPPQNYMAGACYGQCVDFTDRWFVKYVYKKLPEAQSKIWGNGGDPICQCAAGTNGCPTNAALYTVHMPGDKYVPMTGDVLSFSYTHAALVTNVWTDTGGTHLGVAQQNVASTNVVPWLGDHYASESCVIHAKGLVCGDEPALPSPPPAGPATALVYACGNQRRTTVTGDWSVGSYKAECGVGEAVTGLSVRPQFVSAHAAVCGVSDASLLHDTADCHALDITSGNAEPTGSADWDVGHFKGLCNADEYVAGVSQTPSLDVHSVLCCKGQGLTHANCATSVFETADAREAGTTGDWDKGKFKGECGPQRFVTGVSVDADGTHKLHALQCCDGIVPASVGPSSTSSSAVGAGGGSASGAGGAGVGGGGTGTGNGVSPSPGSLHGCTCRVGSNDDGSSRTGLLAAGAMAIVYARRRRRDRSRA